MEYINGRKKRGEEIAKSGKLKKEGKHWMFSQGAVMGIMLSDMQQKSQSAHALILRTGM